LYVILGLGLWCLTPLSSTIYPLYRTVSFTDGHNLVSSTTLHEQDSNNNFSGDRH